MEKIWLNKYPIVVPAEINVDRYRSIMDIFDEACKRFSDRPAFFHMGKTFSFAETDRLSRHFAAYLQKHLGLVKGDRIAIQMPNLLQYPIVMFGALRAGLVIVNTNPLYTPREMEHQFRDAEVKAVVILANFANHLQDVLQRLSIAHIIVTEIGDFHDFPKKQLINFVIRRVKKMVPAYRIPHATRLCSAMEKGSHLSFDEVPLSPSDLAFLQYTGGTTGVSKGAMLSHHNITANVEQAALWMKPALIEGEEVIVTALPLYHIFSLSVNCLTFMRFGACNILITNPKDIPAFIKELRQNRFTVMTGVNTLFNALMNDPDFAKIDFSGVKISVAGATALQRPVAERWRSRTKSIILEGYGLTEASPIVACNPVDGSDRIGTIGLPFPGTEIKMTDDNDQEVGIDQPGELCVKGPQVMVGYWKRQDETDKVIKGGWLSTGDIAAIDKDGFLRIVDRKKDMILVSGFNVYPNEVEEVVAGHPGVLEVAAIGIPDEKSGEAVKIVVVKKNPDLTETELRNFCRESLTGYKIPKVIEFRKELPKTNVGKILRRALR